jgi:hypothetical protein
MRSQGGSGGWGPPVAGVPEVAPRASTVNTPSIGKMQGSFH